MVRCFAFAELERSSVETASIQSQNMCELIGLIPFGIGTTPFGDIHISDSIELS
jgi:hypothetical protein